MSILRRAQRKELVCGAAGSMPLETQKYSMHSYGAQFCEVRVGAITGETRISRFLGSFDVGRILNPKTPASQLKGGIIMGIGLALTEKTDFDERSGRIMNSSLAEYHVPVHMDVPEIEVIWNDIADPHSPLGAHDIGEIGITGAGAAVRTRSTTRPASVSVNCRSRSINYSDRFRIRPGQFSAIAMVCNRRRVP